MARYHNTANGPKRCSTTPERCPITKESQENHYNSLENAQEAYEAKMEILYPAQIKGVKLERWLKPIIIPPAAGAEALLETFITTANKHVRGAVTEREPAFVKSFLDGEIPEEIPLTLSNMTESTSFLPGVLAHGMGQDAGYYAKVTKEFARNIAEALGPDAVILDPLAGRGFFAKAMREQGVPTIASDDKSWASVQIDDESIENLDALASLDKYGAKVTHVLISWAPQGVDLDYRLLQAIEDKHPHITVIAIGEEDGCTGSQAFEDLVRKLGQGDYAVEWDQYGYATLNGLSDSVTFIKPKAKA